MMVQLPLVCVASVFRAHQFRCLKACVFVCYELLCTGILFRIQPPDLRAAKDVRVCVHFSARERLAIVFF